MAAVEIRNIELKDAPVGFIDQVPLAAGQAKLNAVKTTTLEERPEIHIYHESFKDIVGNSPHYSLLLSTAETTRTPFFHEACVFLPAYQELYITSNLLAGTRSSHLPSIIISRVKLARHSESNHVTGLEWSKLRPPAGIDMPNGGVNYSAPASSSSTSSRSSTLGSRNGGGILFCAQGTAVSGTGGIYHLPRNAPPVPLITNYHGRDFNSPNDVIVSRSGHIWFTDPAYAHAQDFRQRPKLPAHVYCFNPVTGDVRVVADGFDRCNGICFSPDEETCYVTDTGMIRGDGEIDGKRASTVYAFDVVTRGAGVFLANRRVFAYSGNGVPDGIKCDMMRNVYAGCGDGVHVWNEGGTMLGKIHVPGGVANFCFGEKGELFLCNETRLWRVCLSNTIVGALLGHP